MTSPTALLDASVLYPAPLRDFLMYLALTDIVKVRWSNRIHQEWINALLRNRPDLKRSQLERTRDLMNAHIFDALVEDFEDRIDDLTLPDIDDRHVLAAAIKAEATLIVTANLRHFPKSALTPHNIEAIPPDKFILLLYNAAPQEVLSAAADHRQSLKNPPKTVTDYLATLEQQGLTKTVKRLRDFEDIL